MLRYRIPPTWRLYLGLASLGLGLAGVFSAGFLLRQYVLQAQYDTVGKPMPFTLESALHYRRVKMMFDRGALPEIDEAIQYPEGIRIRQIDSVSSEPVVARLALLFPENVPFADRIRLIECAWFCLALPLLAWAVRLWTGSWTAGFISAMLYAVSISAVLRTTGQEISRENFAFPWLVGAFAMAAGYMQSGSRRLPWLAGFAWCAALSLIGWDMMQYVIGLVILSMMFHLLSKREEVDRRYFTLFACLAVSIGCVGVLHPYYRYHGLIYSPLYIWLLSVLLASTLRSRTMRVAEVVEAPNSIRKLCRNPHFRLMLIMVLPPTALIVFGLTGSYGASYGHFGELLIAKCRFFNVKPSDPSLLTYYQRIMWVPSLHSATWELTKWLFPYILLVTGAFGTVAWVISRQRPDPFIRFWLLVFVVSLAAFVLFVRFHVFVVLASAMVLGWFCSGIAFPSLFKRVMAIVVVMTAVVAEGIHTVKERPAMGRPNVYYKELNELADWLKDHVSPEPVLANMGVSAFVAAYGKCPIVIHPKFEDPSIRNRLEHYGQLLFGADEGQLRDWMDELGVEYFVYSKGEFASDKPEYQMRYFVNMMEPPDHVSARRFERDDEDMHYFRRLWGNRKYVVYQILTGADEQRADALAGEAERLLAAGKLPDAENAAMSAVSIDKHHVKAMKVLRHVGSLMEQQIRYEPGAVAP